jgi:hypothetical protein
MLRDLRVIERLDGIARIIFHLALVVLTAFSISALKTNVHPGFFQSLRTGSDAGYPLPGSQLELLKNFLPSRGTFTFITNQPVETDREAEFFYYDAQNYLVPLVLNSLPEEHYAIVYCSSQQIAEERLRETGYRWTRHLAGGQGLAEKSP